MHALLLLTALSSPGAAAPSGPACHPIPGWEAVSQRRDLGFLVIGEMHGSSEIPQIFADAVCLTAATRPVTVALEQNEAGQEAIDAFMASNGDEQARATFGKAALLWHTPPDGRSSIAYFQLFETLRAMKAAHRIDRVIGFQPAYSAALLNQAAREEAMAQRLMAQARPGATVVVLVGNVHAMQANAGRPYRTMASYLPPERTITLDTFGNGGSTWACMGNPVVCGTQPVGFNAAGKAPQRHVELLSQPGQPYSGVLYLGQATSASPPYANGAP